MFWFKSRCNFSEPRLYFPHKKTSILRFLAFTDASLYITGTNADK